MCFHYNGGNVYLFVNGTEIINFKVKDSETVATVFCQQNIWKEFSIDDMKKKKTGLNWFVYDFRVDYYSMI